MLELALQAHRPALRQIVMSKADFRIEHVKKSKICIMAVDIKYRYSNEAKGGAKLRQLW